MDEKTPHFWMNCKYCEYSRVDSRDEPCKTCLDYDKVGIGNLVNFRLKKLQIEKENKNG